MTPQELLQAGQLTNAVRALGAEVRDNPADARRRMFLAELLCFSGEYDRAEKHIHVLADAGPDHQLSAVLYFSALHGEKLRQEKFRQSDLPVYQSDRDVSGSLNGQPFRSIVDADPRIGARLEIFAAGAYLWLPFEHIVSIEAEPPRRLRDLLWCPALVRTGPEFQNRELGEVLIPVLCPFSSASPSEAVRLGRETHWQAVEGGEQIPVGQKMFLVDGEEFPLLEMRKLEFLARDAASA